MPGRNHSRYGRNASWAKLVMGETRGYHPDQSLFFLLCIAIQLKSPYIDASGDKYDLFFFFYCY